MSDSDQSKLPAKGQFLVYMAEDGRTKLEVRLENETVWLTQQHMAELFQTTVPNTKIKDLTLNGSERFPIDREIRN